MNNYPTLRLGVLQGLAGLKASCDAEEGYLRKPECPYDEDTVKLLEELFAPRIKEIIKEVQVEKPQRGQVGRPKKGQLNDDDAAEVENEAKGLLKELQQLALDESGEMKNLDTKTKLDIIKARTQLTEKLVSIRERFANVRKVANFEATIISILDDLVPEEKRDEYIRRLEIYRS